MHVRLYKYASIKCFIYSCRSVGRNGSITGGGGGSSSSSSIIY